MSVHLTAIIGGSPQIGRRSKPSRFTVTRAIGLVTANMGNQNTVTHSPPLTLADTAPSKERIGSIDRTANHGRRIRLARMATPASAEIIKMPRLRHDGHVSAGYKRSHYPLATSRTICRFRVQPSFIFQCHSSHPFWSEESSVKSHSRVGLLSVPAEPDSTC